VLPVISFAQCNGHQELCGKPYNEVAFVTTHNAFNAGEEGFGLPNHNFGITRQLNDGVRGLMLDVYDEGGVATVYHGFSFLGTAPLESNLTEIGEFLVANPNEILTIIFECYVDSGMIEAAFTNVGLIPFLHEQTLGEDWPTLQEMINTNKRLVVFTDRNDAGVGQEWYHYVWDFAVETGFTNNAPSDFSCEFNRGDSINDLFILNHFITDATIGVGVPAQAEIVNEFDYFYNRATTCWAEKEKFPNFLTIDFHELGDAFEVADSINGIPSSVGVESISKNAGFSVFPNPSKGLFQIEAPSSMANAFYKVYRSNGQLVLDTNWKGKQLKLDLSGEPDGVYFLSVTVGDEYQAFRLIKL